jgi:hypothetical protein
MAIYRQERCKACGHIDRCEVINDQGKIRSFCADQLNCQKRIAQQKRGRPKGSKNA